MSVGLYGQYGGRDVPETLIPALDELTAAWNELREDAEFRNELEALLRDYGGRPTPLTLAERFAPGKRIYLKREDLLHTGAHKLNNALGQALIAKRLGKPRIVKFAFLAKHIRLGLLCRCELFGVGGEDLLHLRQPLVAFAEFVSQRQTGPLGLRFGDLGTLGPQLRRHALVDGFPGFRKLLLGLPEPRFALAKLRLLVRKLSLEAPLSLRDQRGGKGFGQLDRGAAIRADDLRVGHGRGPRIGVAPCIAALESA